MTREPIREGLYDRVERLVKGRNSIVILLAFLIIGRLVLTFLRGSSGRGSVITAVSIGALALLAGGSLLAALASRRDGRAARSAVATLKQLPTGIADLDMAIQSFQIRTGKSAPRVAVLPQDAKDSSVDAELVYLPDGQAGTFRGPLDAQPGDVAVVVFTEGMLDSFNSAELLAVLLHLENRGQLSKAASAGSSNGACEADSRTLLMTHDHVALLNAIKKSSRNRKTPPPTLGVVRFADADLHTRDVSFAGQGLKWETRDRITELRTQLGAAALDVPE